ncbi:MAG: tyrosine-type recombinase/integrase [Chloracidobacterium sp.]|nr:tyrosine-type recombinase/integrase [Chloracidobacterium sp.]
MRSVDLSLKLACEEAGVHGVTLHTLRHTFGTRLVASGVDLRTVQELMGHANIKTTMIYAHIIEANKHASIARLSQYQENCHEITTGQVVEIKSRRA